MQDNGYVPPMSPDDFAALAAFAGPVYQESKQIESFTSSNPIPGAFKEYGSMNIRQGLEQAHKLAQASIQRPPQPMYVPPAAPLEQPDFVTGTASFVPYPTVGHTPPVDAVKSDDQLEFSFSKTEQKETNDLLREISKKLTKMISLLEESEVDGMIVPKSKPNVKQKQNQV